MIGQTPACTVVVGPGIKLICVLPTGILSQAQRRVDIESRLVLILRGTHSALTGKRSCDHTRSFQPTVMIVVKGDRGVMIAFT